MNDAFRDPLVIEVKYFLPKDEILEQRRAASAGLERILIVGNRDALVGGELPCRRIRALPVNTLMGFTTAARDCFKLAAFLAWRSPVGSRGLSPS